MNTNVLKNVTRVAVALFLLYALWEAYLFRYGAQYWRDTEHIQEVVTSVASDGNLPYKVVNGMPMTKTEYEQHQRTTQRQENLRNLQLTLRKRKDDLRKLYLEKHEQNSLMISNLYSDYINNEKLLKDDTADVVIKRLPGESPRDYKKRLNNAQRVIAPNTGRDISYVKDYANHRKNIDIESLKIYYKSKLKDDCYDLHAEICELYEKSYTRNDCLGGAKKSCFDQMGMYNKKYIRTSFYLNTKLPNSLLAIDLIGDINKVDYATDGYTHLMRAASKGNVERINELLEKEANLETLGANNQPTALMIAIIHNKVLSIKALLGAGADIETGNKNGETALFYAAQKPDLFKALLDAGANIEARNNDGQTVLFKVLNRTYGDKKNKELNMNAVRMILAAGANLEVRDNVGLTPFLHSIGKSEIEAIQTLVSHGANVNAVSDDNKSALHYLAKSTVRKDEDNYTDTLVNLLIDKGVNVNTISGYGYTPLMMAITANNESTFEALLKNNANVNITIDSSVSGPKTALEMTTSYGKEAMALKIVNHPLFDVTINNHRELVGKFVQSKMTDVANVLLDLGANINVTNNFGRTPLMTAAINGDADFLRNLLERGADKAMTDNRGATALSLAKHNRYVKIISLLESVENTAN